MRQWQRPGALPDACVAGRQLEAHTPLRWVYLHAPFCESCGYPWPDPASAGNCPDPLGSTRVRCFNIMLGTVQYLCIVCTVVCVLPRDSPHIPSRNKAGSGVCIVCRTAVGELPPPTIRCSMPTLFCSGLVVLARPAHPPTTPVTGNIHAPWSLDDPGLAGHNRRGMGCGYMRVHAAFCCNHFSTTQGGEGFKLQLQGGGPRARWKRSRLVQLYSGSQLPLYLTCTFCIFTGSIPRNC